MILRENVYPHFIHSCMHVQLLAWMKQKRIALYIQYLNGNFKRESNMKKIIWMFLKMTLVSVLAVCLMACGKKDGQETPASSASLSGDYVLTAVRYADESGEEAFDKEGISGKMTLNEEGTGEVTVFGTRVEITYDTEAKTIRTDQAEAQYTFENNVMEFSLDENFIYSFTKQ